MLSVQKIKTRSNKENPCHYVTIKPDMLKRLNLKLGDQVIMKCYDDFIEIYPFRIV